MEVRVARRDEFDQVMAFYTRMINEMQGTDFDVLWEHGVHPSPEFLRASVEAGEVYVGVLTAPALEDAAACALSGEDRIAAAMVMNAEGEPGYEEASWRVKAVPDEVLVLHVVATLPEFHGRGFARQLLQGGIAAARAADKRALRLDTFSTNVRGRRLYETCGFDCIGVYPHFYPHIDPELEAALYEYAL
ncbi:GNAT family N-acetyltransferase [Eggerthella sp. YY7918]|uniref:GNAT family N-acetyltransferase n=1 Tax=Eggerthella sp. (strain YY7918) TaxID=502558 RepID=UPI000217150D|nr:GNAT family N-acetyltransferase [Eggerthella sp. YY7918]BAK45438.1 hypothetical protein EGYY_23690 [Eggerthella sp. YY7918]